MAEALFNTMGDGVYRAYSAGSAALGIVNRFALQEIKSTHYPINKLRSKGLHEYSRPDAPKIDFLIILDDSFADKALPKWLDGAIKARWQIDHTTQSDGTFDEKKEAFKNTFSQIQNKIDLFTQLPLAHLDQKQLDIEMKKWNSNYVPV